MLNDIPPLAIININRKIASIYLNWCSSNNFCASSVNTFNDLVSTSLRISSVFFAWSVHGSVKLEYIIDGIIIVHTVINFSQADHEGSQKIDHMQECFWLSSVCMMVHSFDY